jgi:hypothetical protein
LAAPLHDTFEPAAVQAAFAGLDVPITNAATAHEDSNPDVNVLPMLIPSPEMIAESAVANMQLLQLHCKAQHSQIAFIFAHGAEKRWLATLTQSQVRKPSASASGCQSCNQASIS